MHQGYAERCVGQTQAIVHLAHEEVVAHHEGLLHGAGGDVIGLEGGHSDRASRHHGKQNVVDRGGHAAADFGIVAGAGFQFGRIIQIPDVQTQRSDTQEDVFVLPKAVHMQQFVGQNQGHHIVHDGDVAQEGPPARAVCELGQHIGSVHGNPGSPDGLSIGGKKFPRDQRTVDVEDQEVK